jgi:hypothetical protein
VGLGDDRQVLVEAAGRHLVEVVAVVVREDDEVQRRQVPEVHGRVGEAGRVQAQAEVRPLAGVEEVRVGEDREPAVAQQHGGRPDEGDLAGREVTRDAVRCKLELRRSCGHVVPLGRAHARAAPGDGAVPGAGRHKRPASCPRLTR